MEYIPKKNHYLPEQDWLKIRRFLSAEDRYLCEILKHTGFRVDDILDSVNLNWEFADLGLIVIQEKKTGKIREFQTDGWTLTLIRSFRDAYGIPDSQSSISMLYFVPSRRSFCSHLNRSTLLRHFQKACAKAGLSNKGYTIHSLRKNFAVDLYRKTRSLIAVQRALNHDKIETTMIYLMDALEFML